MENQTSFTMNDYRRQLIQLGSGSLMRKFLKLMPEMGELAKFLNSEEARQGMRSLVGVIDSMTQAERDDPRIVDENRCRRIAAGAGAEPRDVAQLVKQFYEMAHVLESKTRVARPLQNWGPDIRSN